MQRDFRRRNRGACSNGYQLGGIDDLYYSMNAGEVRILPGFQGFYQIYLEEFPQSDG